MISDRLLAVTAVALLVSACGSSVGVRSSAQSAAPTVAPAVVALSGHVSIKPSTDIIGEGGSYALGHQCDGRAALTSATDGVSRRFFSESVSDVIAGSRVSITNADGKVVGVATLSDGQWQARPTDTNLQDHLCVMSWQLSGPASDFYGVSIAGRPPVQFSRPELTAGTSEFVIEGGRGGLS